MNRRRLTLLCLLIWLFWLIVPTLAFASGSDSIPPVTPYDHPTLGPGLFFPEEAARANDALTEAALGKVRLYEARIGELSILLEAAEVELAQAKDSLLNLRDLVPRATRDAYREGLRRGRHGFGVFVGVNLLEMDLALGVGYVFRF